MTIENYRKSGTYSSLVKKIPLNLSTPSQVLISVCNNFHFNGSGKVGLFKDYQQASLKWIYSVIQSGKLPEEEKSDATDRKEASPVGQFKQLADLAARLEAAKKAGEGLGKPKDASKEENKLKQATQPYNQLKSKYDQAKKCLPVFCWSRIFEPG